MQSTPPGGTIKFSFITPDVTEGILANFTLNLDKLVIHL